MKWKYELVYFGVLISFFILLAGCNGSKPEPISQSTETVQPVSAAPMPNPSQKATVTPVGMLSKYDLPVWLSQPNTPILAALMMEDPDEKKSISFFNADSGETFKVEIPTNIIGYFWLDTMNFGFLSDEKNMTYQIHLETGEVTSKILSSSDMPDLYSGQIYALDAIPQSDEGDISFYFHGQEDISKDKKYIAEWIDENKSIRFLDDKNGNEIWKYELPAGTYGTEMVWSPTKDSIIAIVYGKKDRQNLIIIEDMKLAIIDVELGQILSSYDGNFSSVIWSPDGKKMLYQDPSYIYRTFAPVRVTAPCILTIATGVENCYKQILTQIPAEFDLQLSGPYQWGMDSNTIYYTNLYKVKDQNEITGDLCMFKENEGSIYCPTQNLKLLNNQSIVNFELSPNEEYIYICRSNGTILNDFVDNSEDVIMKADGSKSISWTGTVLEEEIPSCSYSYLWRPLP